MDIRIEEIDGKTYVWPSGRLDALTSPVFENEINLVLEVSRPDIIIDASDLHYVSSAGLRAFLIIQKTINRKKGNLVLRNMQPQVKQVFDMTGLSSIFTIIES